MKKRLFLVLATVFVLSVLLCATTVSAAQSDCLCGDSASTDANNPCAQGGHQALAWTDWSGTTLPTESGNYRLTGDVALTAQWSMNAGNFVIDLAGHSITQTTAGQHVLFFTGTAKVTFTDSVGGGKVVGASGSRMIQLSSGTALDLYGGTLDATAASADYGACMNVNGSTVNMYGGSVLGGTATTTSGGGAVILQNTGTFNLYGGVITGGTNSAAEGCGGAVTTWNAASVFNQYGGTVEGGKAKFGATVFVKDGTYNLIGGNINGGEATYGGAVYVLSKADGFVMNGGTVTGGTAAEGGAAIDVNGGAVSVSGGTLNGGTAKYGGVFDLRGASAVTVSGGTVNGSAVSGSGGGAVIIQSGSFKLTDGEIKGGSGQYGGAVFVFASGANFEMTGGTLTGGTATQGGGSIDVSKGTATISGGTVKGGKAQYGGAVDLRDGGVMTLSGSGVIDGGSSTGSGGGAVIIQGATFTMNGGTVKNGDASTGTGYGGNVFLFSATSRFVMNGGVIESGNAKFGGNIMTNSVAGATVQINGGTVRNGVCVNSGAGGDVYIYTNATMQMTGGEIYGGKRANGSLDSVMIMNATLKMGGGTIRGYCAVQNSNLVLSGDAVIANAARNSGVNLQETVKLVDLSQWTGEGDVLFNGMDIKIAESGIAKGLGSSQGGVVLAEDGGVYIRGAGSRFGCVCGLNENEEHFGACDEVNRLWTGWTSATTLPTATGYYSLAGDVALTEVMLVGDGADVYLDLNGHTVNGPSSDAPKYGSWRVYDFNSTNSRKSLTITDSSAANSGKLAVCDKSNQIGGVIWLRGSSESVLNIYGGTYDATGATAGASTANARTLYVDTGTMNMYGGTLDASGIYGNSGIALYVDPGTTFNMTGGKIIGGIANQGGAAVNVQGGTVNMTGGEIVGGTAQYGAAFNLTGGAVLNLSGDAMIHGGSTTGSGGGNIIVQNGTLNMTGGTVTGGKALTGQGYGGNIMAFNPDAVVNLTGGIVSDGEAKYGGNVFLNNIGGGSTVTLDGVQIFDGWCTEAGAGGNVYAYSNTTLNIKGDTLIKGGMNESGTGDNIFLYRATANISGGEIAGYVHFRNEGTVNLSGAPVIYDSEAEFNLWLGEDYMINITEPLTEGALIGISNSYTDVFTADGCADYANYFVPDMNRYIEVTESGALKLYRYVAQGYAGTETGIMYVTLSEAIADGNNTWIQLIAPVKEDITLTGDLYLDFNGFKLTGNVAGEGTLYGMDSITDEYTCYDAFGNLLCGGIAGEVAPSVSVAQFALLDTQHAPGVRRYLAISDENGYTFHRVYLAVTHTSIAPNTVSVGYKAMFCGDEMVIAHLNETDAFGFTLSLGEGYVPYTAAMGSDKVVSGKYVTLRVANYGVEQFAETPLSAQVFIQLADGTRIESATVSCTFRSLVEDINNLVNELNEAQNLAMQTLCKKFEEVMEGWSIANILAWNSQQA